MAKDGMKTKQGGINLSAEERTVLEKVAKNGGLDWFSYVQRNYGNRRNKDAEHFYPFDRILDKTTNENMSIGDALKRIENEIDGSIINSLDEDEKNIYATLFDRAHLKSNYINIKYSGIFKNKGLFRRAVRWSAMDELADSFVNEEAKKLWNTEGFPYNVADWGSIGRKTMECFRESDKICLTEEEFDRISEVFRKCINM